VIVIEAQPKRKRIMNHHWDANQNKPAAWTAPPYRQREGAGAHPGWNFLPTLISAKSEEKSSSKENKLFDPTIPGDFQASEDSPLRRQDDKALGKRVWKSSRPTHSGVTVMRTMLEIIVPSRSTQAWPCSRPK
jgi:hypothetical protein